MPAGPSRPQLALYVAAAIAVVLLGAKLLRGPGAAPSPPPQPPPSAAAVRVREPAATGAIVHVAGAVRRPGVYRMPAGSRIDDAVSRAGGATPRADLSAVNLAAKVQDGRQVLVPERAGAGARGPTAAGSAGGAGGAGGAGSAAGPSAGGVAAPSASGAAGAIGTAPAQPIDLNTATLEQLDTLAGVGPATAQKILAYRDEHGGFGSVDELRQVPGIGDKRFASLREQVRV